MHEPRHFEHEIGLLLGRTPRADREIGATEDRDAQKSIKHWALLPHQTWDAGKRIVPLAPGELNPGYYDASEKLMKDAALQKRLDALLKDKRFKKVPVALVDLTGDVYKPRFAGHRETDMIFAASIPKIAVMLAAFQVRCDLRALAVSSKVSTAADLFAEARKIWVATQTPASKTVKSFLGLGLRDRLLIKTKKKKEKEISMSVSTRTQTRTGGSNKFKTISTEAHSGRLKIPRPGRMFSVDETRSPIRVTFHAAYQEHLEQMILRSKNDAAEACIEGVGFMTIGSVLMQSGLVHPARGGGLWLRDNYGRECLAKKRGVCVKRKVTQHNFAPFGGDTMEATPASLATFFALLAQRRLVSPSSSADMLALLDDGQTADDTRSPLTETLDRSVPTKVYSKLGLVDDFSDAVLVEREVGGKKLCFAAAAQELSLPTINALGVELEKIIRENNDV